MEEALYIVSIYLAEAINQFSSVLLHSFDISMRLLDFDQSPRSIRQEEMCTARTIRCLSFRSVIERVLRRCIIN